MATEIKIKKTLPGREAYYKHCSNFGKVKQAKQNSVEQLVANIIRDGAIFLSGAERQSKRNKAVRNLIRNANRLESIIKK